MVLAKINRMDNLVVHAHCQLGYRELSGGVLQGLISTRALKLALNDCNNDIIT